MVDKVADCMATSRTVQVRRTLALTLELRTNLILNFSRPWDIVGKYEKRYRYSLIPFPLPAFPGRKIAFALPVEDVSALMRFPKLPIVFALSSFRDRHARFTFRVASSTRRRPPTAGGELLTSPSGRRVSERVTTAMVMMTLAETLTRGRRDYRGIRSVSTMRCPSGRVWPCRRRLERKHGRGGGDGEGAGAVNQGWTDARCQAMRERE